MALTLAQIRSYVRSHLDLELDDLPNELVDVWVREGSKRIERAEPRWPFYEQTYPLAVAANSQSVTRDSISADLDQLVGINHDTLAFPPLVWVGFDAFQEFKKVRPGALGRPVYFAEWGNLVYFYPQADIDYQFTVHAYRKAADWMAGGAGATPDMPDELHNTVAMWALARAYAQQEDPELASLYERQFSDELNEYRRRLVVMPHNQPLVLGGGTTPEMAPFFVRPRFDWETS